MTNRPNIEFIVVILVIIAAAFLAGRCSCDCPEPETEIITKIDTVTVVNVLPPDTVMITKPRIVFRQDTIIDSTVVIKYRDTAWTASDEVVNAKSDTIVTEFLYPEMMFKHRFNYSTDSTKIITIFKDKIIVKQRPWWETPVTILGGVAAGYLLGRTK
jgi:hypothetical protein